jgi:Uma2 family endonuclease
MKSEKSMSASAAVEGVAEVGGTIISEKLTFEQFLKKYAGVRADWLVGEVELTAVSNNTKHNDILGFLFTFFNLYLSLRGLGRVLLAGVSMYLGDDVPAREPDIMIVLTERLDRITPTYLNGAADIVIEIVSPESVARDRGTKLAEYEKGKVPEYWLIDPDRRDTIIHVLHPDGFYRTRPLDAQGRITSAALPGFALDPTLFWQDTLPNGVEALALVQQMIKS